MVVVLPALGVVRGLPPFWKSARVRRCGRLLGCRKERDKERESENHEKPDTQKEIRLCPLPSFHAGIAIKLQMPTRKHAESKKAAP